MVHMYAPNMVRLTDYTKYSMIWRSAMFEYMALQEAAALWKISERQVKKLCKANRMEGVIHLSRVWLIPETAKKPLDVRRKSEN